MSDCGETIVAGRAMMQPRRAADHISEHPAVRAWAMLHPRSNEPAAVETIKESSSSSVYRLVGVPRYGRIIAKWCEREGAATERSVYRDVLPRVPVATPRYHGTTDGNDAEHAWLFLEDAAGEPYSASLAAHRRCAARWLATMHAATAAGGTNPGLPGREPGYYRGQLRRARETILGNCANPALRADEVKVLEALVAHCERLEAAWQTVERQCHGIPESVVHGDFVEKNMRVRSDPRAIVLLPFDWEVAGWGIAAADLAECPDLAAYWQVAREWWPHCTVGDLERVAAIGRVFRLIDAIGWASDGLDNPWTHRAMESLRCYVADMAAICSVVTTKD